MRTIFHYGGWCRNYGDMAIQFAMQEKLIKFSEEPLNFIPIDLKLGHPLTMDDVDYMNGRGDLLIVGGGGMIMKGDGFDTESDWQFNISKECLHAIKIPIVIYGIGLNIFPYDNNGKLNKFAINHIKYTMDMASLISVRNGGTKNFLRDIGVSRHITVIPDPAMFVSSCNVKLPVNDDHYLIGINWAGDRTLERYENIDEMKQIEKITEVCKKILSLKGGGKVVWIPHVSKYDLFATSHFKSILGNDFLNIVDCFPMMYPEQYFHVPQLAGIYKKMDMVLAMRGHGNIISFGQGTRCIAYGDHQKVKFFSKEYDTYWLPSSCTEFALFASMLDLSLNGDFDRNTHAKVGILNQKIDDFNHEVLLQIKDWCN